jgi:transcriptional regulator with PAS, ATPase and Fis domain
VAVHCAALPETLLESELFGYKAGAFTDARRDKAGRFELAAGGTLFLDEVADVSIALQSKLLRVLQEKTYEPLGGDRSLRADVRIVSASNKDLRAQMALGRFRDDLYYRLNVVCIDLPPLKDRAEDIPLLVDAFISRFNAEKNRELTGITTGALEALMHYDFPGNVRELENIIERAFILCRKDVIDVHDLPSEIRPPAAAAGVCQAAGVTPLKAAEAEAIRRALAIHGWHRQRTADALGIHKTTLLRKMKALGIRQE